MPSIVLGQESCAIDAWPLTVDDRLGLALYRLHPTVPNSCRLREGDTTDLAIEVGLLPHEGAILPPDLASTG